MILLSILMVLSLRAQAGVQQVLMMTHESASEMSSVKAAKYCRQLTSKCELKTSGTCGDQEYAGWTLPEKEDLDRFSDRSKSKHFVWTKSYLIPAGRVSLAVYRLSQGGAYAPNYGRRYHVRCVMPESGGGHS
jgi:hypothetical protein